MSVYGYIRVSSKDQKEDRQQIALKEVGVERQNIYVDKQSGKDFNRPQYKKMLRKLKKDDLLTKIQTGSTAYNFGYGNFDLRSSITMGSRTLASYSYTDRTHYLSALDYGNGDKVQYTYDQQGRVTKETYEDGLV